MNLSVKTFWKNRDKTGVLFFINNSIIKLIKLLIYFFYFIAGATDAIIKKRSIKLAENNKKEYNNILNQAIL